MHGHVYRIGDIPPGLVLFRATTHAGRAIRMERRANIMQRRARRRVTARFETITMIRLVIFLSAFGGGGGEGEWGMRRRAASR